MKVSELFESTEAVSHAKIVSAISDLVAKHLKIDADLRADALDKLRNTDEFWSSEIDQVTKKVEAFIKGSVGREDVAEAIYNALMDIGENIVSHYSNAMNHAPGFKKPKVVLVDVEDIRDAEMFKAIHAAAPAFKAAHDAEVKADKEHKAHIDKAEVAKITPELIEKFAKYLSEKCWPLAFSEKWVRMAKKNPKFYSDWFTLSQIESFKTGADIEKILLKGGRRELLDWVMDSNPKHTKEYGLYLRILNTPSLLKKLLPLIPQLKA